MTSDIKDMFLVLRAYSSENEMVVEIKEQIIQYAKDKLAKDVSDYANFCDICINGSDTELNELVNQLIMRVKLIDDYVAADYDSYMCNCQCNCTPFPMNGTSNYQASGLIKKIIKVIGS